MQNLLINHSVVMFVLVTLHLIRQYSQPKDNLDFDIEFVFLINFLNGPTRPLFRLFSVCFKQTIRFLQQINVKKCPSSTRHWDLNPQPPEHESSPITTRPGLCISN